MQAIDVFLSRLMPMVLGCPDPMARQAILDSAIEFCEETAVTQVTCSPMSVVAGQATYPLTVPADQAVATVLKAWFKTAPLTLVPSDKVNNILAFTTQVGDDVATAGDPFFVYEVSPGVVGLYPVPDANATEVFNVRAATKPSRGATTLEDVLFNDWCEAVVAGAAYRIFSVPGQSFTDPAAAAASRLAFQVAVGKASSVAARGRVRSSLSVRPIAFA